MFAEPPLLRSYYQAVNRNSSWYGSSSPNPGKSQAWSKPFATQCDTFLVGKTFNVVHPNINCHILEPMPCPEIEKCQNDGIDIWMHGICGPIRYLQTNPYAYFFFFFLWKPCAICRTILQCLFILLVLRKWRCWDDDLGVSSMGVPGTPKSSSICRWDFP